jgi:uncharacterized protein YceH (UPF0502 family)
MDETDQTQTGPLASQRNWQPLNAIQRRVAGVLVEKAKTVPETYPMTLNGVVTASNQKSNRSPKMELTERQVEDALDELRSMGAVIEVHGGGRVPKYKHCLYEWLGVDKVELAIVAELLLRGEQTLGDLRARVARMEEIPDLSYLQPRVRELIQKGLVQPLTPDGRGQVVSHALYEPHEQDALARQFPGSESESLSIVDAGPVSSPVSTGSPVSRGDEIHELRTAVLELTRRVDALEKRWSEYFGSAPSEQN